MGLFNKMMKHFGKTVKEEKVEEKIESKLASSLSREQASFKKERLSIDTLNSLYSEKLTLLNKITETTSILKSLSAKKKIAVTRVNQITKRLSQWGLRRHVKRDGKTGVSMDEVNARLADLDKDIHALYNETQIELKEAELDLNLHDQLLELIKKSESAAKGAKQAIDEQLKEVTNDRNELEKLKDDELAELRNEKKELSEKTIWERNRIKN